MSKDKNLTEKKTNILLVEDHEVFRMGLKELLSDEDDLYICGEADNINTAWKMIADLNPDFVIVDISLKDSDGIELVKNVNKHYKEIPILVLSMYNESLYAERALNAGARGYIMKHETSDSIVKAVRTVLQGEVYVSSSIMSHILNRYTGHASPEDTQSIEKLTNRELDIFRLIGSGMTTGDIAKKLNISVKTVGTYRERIKEKLNLKNAAELARYAIQWFENNI